MLCPHCLTEVNEHWQSLFTHTNARGEMLEQPSDLVGVALDALKLYWMRCPKRSCQELFVAATAADGRGFRILYPQMLTTRRVDPAVPDALADNYRQASAILTLSPKMSATLARRILADVLKQYGGYEKFTLASQLKAFMGDTQHPSQLRENARYLTEIGDFGSHTQRDTETQEIVDVEPEEAEWTLEVLDGLFEYFIVGPVRDEARRAAIDAKIAATGRKPIRKGSDANAEGGVV